MKFTKIVLIPVLLSFTIAAFPSLAQASNHTPECLRVQSAKLDLDRAKADQTKAINEANRARGTVGSAKAQALSNKAIQNTNLYFKLLQQAQKDCSASNKTKKK